MTVLDTFYLLFKTDIPAGVEKDIAALDKQIDALAAKGKKRSDEENKQYLALKKQRKDALQDFKDQQQQVDKIGDSFRGLAQNALAAFTAFASFQGIKSGLLDTAKLNSGLLIQSQITGESVDELRAYSAAVETAGGSSEGFISTLNNMAAASADQGVAFTKVGALLDSYNKQIQNLPKQEQRRILALGGITDPGAIALLEKTPEEYKKIIDKQRELTAATREDYEAARTFEAARTDALHSLTSAFTHLGADVLPWVSKELQEFDGYIKDLEKEKGGVEKFFTETAAVAIGAWTPLGRLVLATYFAAKEIGQAESDIAHGTNKSYLAKGAQAIADYFYPGNPKPKPTPSQAVNPDAVAFWKSQGYSDAQAAGIAANEQAESSGKPGARNVDRRGGVHYGLYQWDETRRAKILAATGIDVASASVDQQRAAAAWELHARGDDERIKTAATPEASAAIVNSYYEVSGENPLHRMQIAHQLEGQILPQIASPAGIQNSGGDRTLNVKIDEVHINTQATDAQGISKEFSDAFKKELHTTFSDWDDGQNF